MEREVTDENGITWTCVQAYSGVSDTAAQVKGQDDTYWVVCTPSGSTQSVRVQLKGDWEKDYSNQALLDEITASQNS